MTILPKTMRVAALVMALSLCTAAQQNPAAKQEPLWLDFDMQNIPEPKKVERGYAYDFADGIVFQQVKQLFDLPRHGRAMSGNKQEAYNVNALDEVPDSSWFTNRNGRKRMSLDELRRGPDRTDGPAPGRLTVTRGKSTGISAGFWVKDSRGDTYIFKFDTVSYPEMATAAEVIASKLFYAIGYNVPQNTIFRFRRDELVVDEKAKYTDVVGRERKMTMADVNRILKKAAQQDDGRYRVVASKLLTGKDKGGFAFAGVRKGDGNDIIPHEHRRDLRGLRVFSAWLEHNDIRAGNTLDMYVEEEGRKFVRHYLIDLGSTLGSDTVFPNVEIVGYEHQLDWSEAGKSLFSLGLYQQPWYLREREVKYTAVGAYTSEYFKPHRWKQNFPLAAFENMTDRDAYWAAKIVGSFTDEQIVAAVAAGEISDPAAEAHLAQNIIARRDLITQHYYKRVAALEGFRVDVADTGAVVRFRDLRAGNGSAAAQGYEYEIAPAHPESQSAVTGKIPSAELTLSKELLEQIAEFGSGPQDGGVARLTLRRLGETQEKQVFVYADGRGTVRLLGQVN
jgi:hypothetical protein